jgi:hypothetical protein
MMAVWVYDTAANGIGNVASASITQAEPGGGASMPPSLGTPAAALAIYGFPQRSAQRFRPALSRPARRGGP